MKKLLLTAALFAAGIHCMADDYQYLTAAYNGVEQSFELATVQKIVFENGNVLITTSKGTTSLPQSEMEKMFFSTTATTINTLPGETSDLQLSNDILRAKGNGMLHIYNSAGQLLQMKQIEGENKISLRTLPKGIYLINLGTQTIKISK